MTGVLGYISFSKQTFSFSYKLITGEQLLTQFLISLSCFFSEGTTSPLGVSAAELDGASLAQTLTPYIICFLN